MSKIFWKSLIAAPAILLATLAVSTEVKANDEFKTENFKAETEQFIIAQEATKQDSELLNQLDNYSSEGGGATKDQVTSVSQLRDVQPTDWAYEALRSLVERYGCIVGYPDRTYRGNRSLSRYEFAAGLNACMQQMERLIASSESVMREDIDKLKRLMKEFEAELAALGARVDNLEGRTAFLEDHQFSTTTKLSGEVIFALTQNFVDQNQAILADRVRLELNTSFSGDDRLVTRLSAGNAGQFQAQTDTTARIAGQPNQKIQSYQPSATLNQTFNLYPGENNDVQVDWLAYYAPLNLSENTRLNTYIAAWGGIHSDYAPTLNPYFEDYDGGNGALSTFASQNPIYRIGGGAGAALSYELGFLESLLGPSTLTVGYMAGGSPNSPQAGEGVFNGDYSILGQLNVNISDTIALGLTYVNGFHKSGSPIFGAGASSGNGIVGTQRANLSSTSLNSVFAEEFGSNIVADITDKSTNSYGAEFAWRVSKGISLSAFFNYTNATIIGRGNNEIWAYGGGIAFPDLGKEGNILGLFAGVQPYNGSSTYFVTNTDTGESGQVRFSNNAVPIHIEGFYKYQLNDNISITPGVIWISAPFQDSGNGQIIGTLRSTFTF
jgi:hypothetical protein